MSLQSLSSLYSDDKTEDEKKKSLSKFGQETKNNQETPPQKPKLQSLPPLPQDQNTSIQEDESKINNVVPNTPQPITTIDQNKGEEVKVENSLPTNVTAAESQKEEISKVPPQENNPTVTITTDEKDAGVVLNLNYNIFELLDKAVALGASDLHLVVDYPPFYRVDGKLIRAGSSNVKKEEIDKLMAPVLGTKFQEQLEINKEVDFSYAHGATARFRINAFNQKGSVAGAFRLIPSRIPSLEQLKLPPIIEDFTKLPQGFVLVVGPTGSGKSTTLASMLNLINERDTKHIITVEDPIEYVFSPAKSLVVQREIGSDTHSWDIALRSVLREDPNIVLVGEMRDYETIAAALTVAETGHLVFATLHTNSASQAIDRIIHVFPAEQQAQIRIMLANVITAVISQRLIPTIGGGRRAAMEILVGNPAVSNMIRDSKEHLIDNVIQTSMDAGMVPMEKSLVELIREGKITVEEAQNHTTKVDELLRLLNKE